MPNPMRQETLAVIGASGFVGSALCERLHFEGGWKFVPFIHSSGSAARLARLRLSEPPRMLDLLDFDSLRRTLRDDMIVVNCGRGDDKAMSRGFRNLVKAARECRVRKFIHIGSVAIYGEDPPLESADPSCPVSPLAADYGILKQRQDALVFDLHSAGIPSCILCPSNISGPYGLASYSLAQRLLEGPLPLVDEGRNPCNLVHVDNLVEALLTAAASERGGGRRYFVNELEPVSWKRYLEDFCRLLEIPVRYLPVSRETVVAGLKPQTSSKGLAEHVRIALSGEFRKGLMKMPVFEWGNGRAAAAFEALPREWQSRIKEKAKHPVHIPKAPAGPSLSDPWVKVQARRPFHSPETLVRELGFQPVLSYEKGLDLTARWFRFLGIAGPGQLRN
jgi:nucleoside-diphosphate-sugar epimerase